MELHEFLKMYKKGERIFQSVLYRHFGNKAQEVAEYLLANHLAHKDYILRCPHCDFACYLLSQVAPDNSWEFDTDYCVSCGEEIKVNHYIREAVFIYEG